MNHLFSIFDPVSGVLGWKLNWLSSLSLLMMLAPYFWVSKNSGTQVSLNMMKSLAKDLELNLGSQITPGLSHMMVSIFVFIMLNNFLGLLPYIFTSSSHLVFTLSLVFPLWMGSFLYGLASHPLNILSHFVPLGTPFLLMPLMVMIELISVLIRPMTLSVRLMANMVAGHLLLHLVGGGIYSAGFFMSIPILGSLLLMMLEIGVSFIQAYVYSMLLTLYISESGTWKTQ